MVRYLYVGEQASLRNEHMIDNILIFIGVIDSQNVTTNK